MHYFKINYIFLIKFSGLRQFYRLEISYLISEFSVAEMASNRFVRWKLSVNSAIYVILLSFSRESLHVRTIQRNPVLGHGYDQRIELAMNFLITQRYHRLRGGSNDRTEMEAKIKQERALEAERIQKLKEAQERRKLDREQAAMQQLAVKEEEDARNQLIQKRKRKLPEVLTLENLSRYAKDLLQDREFDQAVEAYRRVLLVDPYDVGALHDMGYIMQGAEHRKYFSSFQWGVTGLRSSRAQAGSRRS
jgi:hypothetical protein